MLGIKYEHFSYIMKSIRRLIHAPIDAKNNKHSPNDDFTCIACNTDSMKGEMFGDKCN